MHRLLVWIAVFFFSIHEIRAQQDVMMDDIGNQLHLMVDAYVHESFLEQEFTQDLSGFHAIFSTRYSDSIEYEHLEAERLAEIRTIEKDLGLNLTANYTRNFDGAVLDEEGAFYDWRTSGGLSWNILRSGMVNNKHRAQQKKLQWEAEKSMQDQKFKEFGYRKTYDYIIYVFNKRKLEVVERRLEILDQLLEVANRMFYLKLVQWDHVLEVLSKRAETALFLKNYATYLDAVQLDSLQRHLQVGSLPVFDLNYDQIRAIGIDTLARHKALQHKLAALEHQFHWSKDVNLSAQLRYNYYSGSNISSISSRDFLGGGISFGIPLPLSRGPQKDWKNAKSAQLKSSYESYQNGVQNELLNHFYEYEYALKQYVSFYFKKERVATLIKRGMRKKRLQDPDFSPLQVMDRLEELFSIEIELLDIHQKMYLKALKVFTLIRSDNLEPLIQLQDFARYATNTPGGRNIFCGSELLMNLETRFLAELLTYNEADEVLVSIERRPEVYLKYASLLDALKSHNTKARLSVRPIEITAAAMAELEETISFALTSRVHIDFSRKILSQEERYLVEAFLDRNHGGYDISISLHIDESTDFRRRLYPFTSYVNLVPEHSDDLMGLYHIVEDDRWNGFDKLRLVVRPQDFSYRLELDEFIKQLMDHLEISEVGLSDLQSLLDLEKSTISWHEERGL